MGQHLQVVIEFQNQPLAILETLLHQKSDLTGVCATAKPGIACIYNKANGILGIMRDSERPDLQILKGDRIAGCKFTALEQLLQPSVAATKGPLIGINGNTASPGQDPDSADMIVVVMGHEDCIKPLKILADGLQPGYDLLAGKTVIDQDRRATGLDIDTVAAAAASQDGKLHQTPVWPKPPSPR